MRLILPELDIWMRALSRTAPDPQVAAAFTQAVRDRRVLLFGPLRQTLIMRARDLRQSRRLAWILAGFPTPLVAAADHEAAAARALDLAGRRIVLTPWQALAWTVADRLGAQIWSGEPHWQELRRAGCPVGAPQAGAAG